MTSANVTHYHIIRRGKVMVKFRQNHFCKQHALDDMRKWYAKNGNAALVVIWPDENEVPQYSKPCRLKSYIDHIDEVRAMRGKTRKVAQ